MKVRFAALIFLWFIIFTINSHNSSAQAITKTSISGYVVDDSTKKPLQFVNVFLSNTSLGSTTDENGFYLIKYVALGNYVLVASMMGYELEKVEIRLTDVSDKKFDFYLKPKVLSAPEIEVSTTYPHQWKKNLKRFEELFLGNTKNAPKCKILNPEVLDFEKKKGNITFTASAAQPLLLENKALGYRVQLFLDDFKEYRNGELKYRGITKFEGLPPKDETQRKEWEQNRRDAYFGSLRHFLISLVAGTYEDEGFLIYNTPIVPNKKLRPIYYPRISVADSILSMGNLPFERILRFDDYLSVIYEKGNQLSGLKLNYDSATITTSGYIQDHYPLTHYGYWAQMRAAEFLPIDYEPFKIQPHSQSQAIDSLLTYADSLFAAGDIRTAQQIYEEILKIDKNCLQAKEGIDLIAVETKEWDKNQQQQARLFQHEQTEIEDHYNRAIRYRESGKFKALLLRKIVWDKSKKHFLWIIERDSLYKDVLYQYALLLRYRKKYKQAIIAGQAQIRLRPDLIEPQVKLFNLYQHFIHHRNLTEVITWLDQQPWDHARYFIGEKFRREGYLEKADSVFQQMLPRKLSMPKQPIYLSLARLYYQQRLPQLAEQYYWRAVSEIKDQIEAALVFEDLKYIISDQELKTYLSLDNIPSKIEFFHSMWIRRDPTPAAKFNVRLAEHYRRLRYAEKYYEYDGFRGWYNNPDKSKYLKLANNYQLNHEFNDKGLVYIRHGEPDDKALTAGGDVPFNESWLYYKTQITPKMTFHFKLENTTSYWRFSPVLTNPRLLEDRLTWGSIYHKLLTASNVEILPYITEMAMESRQSVEKCLSTDRHTWAAEVKPLDIPFSTATFRGKQGKTILELYSAISLTTLTRSVEHDGQYIELENGFSIHDQKWNQIVSDQKNVFVPVSENKTFIDYYHYEIPPDSYNVAFFARPTGSSFLGGSKFQRQVDDYSKHGLAMSDIQLANRIEPADKPHKFVKSDLFVIPNPAHLYSRKNPVYIYFEIYNLSKNTNGSTTFNIEYTLKLLKHRRKGLSKLFSFLDRGQSSITLTTDREGNNEFSAEYLSIDVSKTEAGKYELAVTVTDKHSGDKVERLVKLSLL